MYLFEEIKEACPLNIINKTNNVIILLWTDLVFAWVEKFKSNFVFFIIAPNGRKIALAASKKEKSDLNLSLRAKVRSVHNNIITLLVLFIMLSGHASFVWVNKYNWLILSLLAVVFGVIQYYVNYKNKKENN